MQSDSGDDGDNSIFGQIQMPLTRTPFVGLSEEDEREGWGCTQGKVFQSGPLTQNIQKQNCLVNIMKAYMQIFKNNYKVLYTCSTIAESS